MEEDAEEDEVEDEMEPGCLKSPGDPVGVSLGVL